MGRGRARPGRTALMAPAEILARTRLTDTELRGRLQPVRIARAIRAELWFGTLADARLSANLGARNLMMQPDAWRSPALVGVGLGDDALRTCARTHAAAIVRSCADALTAVESDIPTRPVLAAVRLLGLADVLGPLSYASQAQLSELCQRAVTLSRLLLAHAAADGDHRVSASLSSIEVRFTGWMIGGWSRVAAAYDVAVEVDSRSAWDVAPRVELLLALALGGTQIATADLASLPPCLRAGGWTV